MGRLSAGLFAGAVAIVFFLHASIVLAYAGGSAEGFAGGAVAMLVVGVVIAMWGLERPRRAMLRTVLLLVMVGAYIGSFTWWD
jgi:hypothetical protein